MSRYPGPKKREYDLREHYNMPKLISKTAEIPGRNT